MGVPSWPLRVILSFSSSPLSTPSYLVTMTVPFMSRFTMKEMLLPSTLPSLIAIGSPAPPRPPAGIVPVNVLPSAFRVMVTGRPGLPPRPGCSKVHLPETSAAINAKDATNRIVITKRSFLVIVSDRAIPGRRMLHRARWRVGPICPYWDAAICHPEPCDEIYWTDFKTLNVARILATGVLLQESDEVRFRPEPADAAPA